MNVTFKKITTAVQNCTALHYASTGVVVFIFKSLWFATVCFFSFITQTLTETSRYLASRVAMQINK